ncbi:hypothetical protein FRC06_003621 [Ceratobasidium sp. 370]|nr:hypothetical protein FRC06_003621 [Ceratobasidium sp. 370]
MEAQHFYGPMFELKAGEDRPSVIGNEDPYALEVRADSEPDETRALVLLARSAIGYHCKSDGNKAYDIQARIGWIHISREHFLEAQAHLEVAKKFFEAQHDYYSVVTCQRGLAEAAQDLNERIRQYTPALALCSARKWVDQEAFIVRELGNTILAQSELAEGGEKQALISRARLHLTEALSLYAGQANLKLQAQVRCELLLLEWEARNDSAAQTHASAAFQCAQETRDRNFAEEVCDYLKSTNALSEAMYNAIDFGLHKMTLDTLDRMLQTRVDLPRADSQLDVYFI